MPKLTAVDALNIIVCEMLESGLFDIETIKTYIAPLAILVDDPSNRVQWNSFQNTPAEENPYVVLAVFTDGIKTLAAEFKEGHWYSGSPDYTETFDRHVVAWSTL